jgi:phosphoribosylanthranilate isomerase
MKVKVCGITRSEDLLRCESSGAELVGFISIERSKRRINLKEIKELVLEMKNKRRAVLVLEPENVEEVVMKMKKTGIRNVQLHSLSASEIKYLRWIEGFNRNPFEQRIKIIRALGLSEDSTELVDGEIKLTDEKIREIESFALICDAITFDYQIKGKSGGTGKQIPLEIVLMAVKIAKTANHNIEIILAGGINSEIIKNEKDILEKIFDYMDVNSGVEDAPGIKNSEKIDELLKISAQ